MYIHKMDAQRDLLREKATCSQCLQPFSESPKILPSCLHTFCLPCLSKLPTLALPTEPLPSTEQSGHTQPTGQASSNGQGDVEQASCSKNVTSSKVQSDTKLDGGVCASAKDVVRPRAHSGGKSSVAIKCPRCAVLCPLPPSGLEDLQTSIVAKELVAASNHLENYNNDTPVCERCMGNPPAQGFCYTCYSFICEDCFELHKRWASYENHNVDDLDTFRQKRAGLAESTDSVTKQCLMSSENSCLKHSDEKLKFYCTSCEELLCHDCTVIAHRNHPTESITAEFLGQHRMMVSQSLKELDDNRQGLDEISGTVVSRNAKLTSLQSELKQDITTTFANLEESLKSRKGELLSEVDAFTKPPLQALEEFKQRVEALQTQVLESRTLVEASCNHEGPTGMLSIERTVLKHMDDLQKQCQSVGPIQEVPNVSFQRSEGVDDTIKSFGSVVVASDHDSLNPGPTHSSTPMRHDASSPYPSNMLLETLSSQILETLNRSSVSLGRQSFTSETDEIRSSDSSSDIEKLMCGIPIRAINDLNRPSGVTVTNNIIVCELGAHQVLVLDYLGRKMLTIGTEGESDGHFVFPQKTVFNHEGKMIITDGNCRFQVFSPAGRWLQTIKTDFNPASIAVGASGRIYVCDKVNHKIRVFNKDFTFHKEIGHRGRGNCEFNNPSGIVADNQIHLYVADAWNHRIQVLNEDGSFVRKFGSKGSNPGQLNCPSNLCVDHEGRFLFISESRNHRVSIFKTTGRFVKCFGRYGQNLGELDRPRGITIDFNNLLYVCDYGNNRIQIFK